MNLADTLRRLLRRWYIVIPGLLIAIAVAIAAWQVIKPTYERTSTQLLLPGEASIPEAGNPYLYLGGLSQAADVLVTAMSSENELAPILEEYPGAEIVVARDPMTSGPQLRTTVSARSDEEAGEILSAMVATTENVLDGLQDVDGITSGNRIGIKTITQDAQSTLDQKTRLLGVAAAALVIVVLTLVLAALLDGLSTRRRRRGAGAGAYVGVDDEESEENEPDTERDPESVAEESSAAEEPQETSPSTPSTLGELDLDRLLSDIKSEDEGEVGRPGATKTSRRTR